MTDVNPWADPSVKAKINQQGLGGNGAPRAESRRLLATPPAPYEAEEYDRFAFLNGHPHSNADFERMIASAAAGQQLVQAPEYTEENSGKWRNTATDAAREMITAFTVTPGVFSDILAKADQVANHTEIGTGLCSGDMLVFLREVEREVILRDRKQAEMAQKARNNAAANTGPASVHSPFRKDRFHLTPGGIKVLAEIDAAADALGMVGVTELGKARREVLGTPVPDFKGTPEQARERLKAWQEKQNSMSRIVGGDATTQPLAAPVVADASGVVVVNEILGYDQGDYDWREDHNLYPFDTQEYPMTDDFTTPAAIEAAEVALDAAPEPRPFVKIDAERTAFFKDYNDMAAKAGIPMGEREEFRHTVLGSLKSYEGTRAEALNEIGIAIDERNKTIMEADKAKRGRAMSLICPSGNGSIVYKGIRYLRQAAEIADPSDLLLGLQEWAAWWASVEALGIAPDENCRARSTASVPARPIALQGATPPPQSQPAPNSASNGEGGQMTVLKIVKSVDDKKNCPILKIWPQYGAAIAKWPMWNEEDKPVPYGLWDKISAVTGIDWREAEFGKTWEGKAIAAWKPSKNVNKNGEPYKNLSAFTAMPAESAQPF